MGLDSVLPCSTPAASQPLTEQRTQHWVSTWELLPTLALALTLALFCSRYLATSMCPALAAMCRGVSTFCTVEQNKVVRPQEGTCHQGVAQEHRKQGAAPPLHPTTVSSNGSSQARTHHIGHIRRCSTLQQGFDDGQVPHEGSHMQRGQAGLWRESTKASCWMA